MQKQKTILFAITLTVAVRISILSIPTAMAADSVLTATGTSMPSNATHT